MVEAHVRGIEPGPDRRAVFRAHEDASTLEKIIPVTTFPRPARPVVRAPRPGPWFPRPPPA